MADNDDPWQWGVGGIVQPDPASESEIPALASMAGLLLVRRILQHTDPPKQFPLPVKRLQDQSNAKYHRLERLVWVRAEETRQAVKNMPEESRVDVPDSLSALRAKVHRRLPEALCLSLLISAWATDPLTPFEIKVDDKVLNQAMADFAQDLGVPKSWAEETQKAVDEARRVHAPNRIIGVAVTVLGVGAMLAAAPLVIAAAPAAVTGGAVIMAGLAALGPGGMMGGLAIVTALAGAGGVTAAAGAFVAGSPAQVAENVTILHSTALAKSAIRPGSPPRKEIKLLEEMRVQLSNQVTQHEAIDDKPSKALNAAKKKHEYVEKALEHLKKERRK